MLKHNAKIALEDVINNFLQRTRNDKKQDNKARIDLNN